VVDAYRWLAIRLMSFPMERMRRNLSVVNSDFIGARVRALHGVETVTLYPPVAGNFPAVPWEQREDAFLCVRRISPEKRIEQIIAILSRVRDSELAPHLHIIGTPDNDAYVIFIRNCVSANRSWVTLHAKLTRQALARLMSIPYD
jgi:glycosyltransferase involved in cell wall biosynthesis